MHGAEPTWGSAPARLSVATGVIVTIALLHVFRLGSYLSGRAYVLYYSYFSDIALPFGMYFLLCAVESRNPRLHDRRLKAALAFGPAAVAETLQAFGMSALGVVFDPLDLLMYAAGTGLALLADLLLARLLPGWAWGERRLSH